MGGLKCCRMCLGADAHIDGNDPKMQTIIQDLFAFWVNYENSVTRICPRCAQKMEDFHKFYEQVRQNQLILSTQPNEYIKQEVKEVKMEWEDVFIPNADTSVSKSNPVYNNDDNGENEASMSDGRREDDDEDYVCTSEEDEENGEDEEEEEDEKDHERAAWRAGRDKLRKKHYAKYPKDPKELVQNAKYVVKWERLENMANRFYKIQCGECRGKPKFSTLKELKKHFSCHHSNQRVYVKCCKKKVRESKFIVQHMVWHLHPSAFQCTICRQKLSNFYTLKTHLRIHRSEGAIESEEVENEEECEKNENGDPKVLVRDGKFIVKWETLEDMANRFFKVQCGECADNQKFPTLKMLKRHFSSQHRGHRVYVECCDKKIHDSKFIIQHMAKHMQPSAFECRYCKQDFATFGSLNTHVKLHTSKEEVAKDDDDEFDDSDDDYLISNNANSNVDVKTDADGNPSELVRNGRFIVKKAILERMASKFFTVECGVCHDMPKFDDLKSLKQHYSSIHRGEQASVECCDKRIYERVLMYQHMAKHLQPTGFQCGTCNKEFTRLTTLRKHLKIHSAGAQKLYNCETCGQGFYYSARLKQHMASHKNKSFKCEFCPKMLSSVRQQIDHVQTYHTTPKFLCPECGKGFYLEKLLKIHLERHTGKKAQCKLCHKMYATVFMKIHMRTHHSGIRFYCDQCEYSTHEKKLLKHHMAVKHSDAKPFACDVCGKKFKVKAKVQIHMAQHTGERKYACAYCPKTFAQSGNYYSHRTRMHREEHENAMKIKYNENLSKCVEIDE